MLNQVSKLCDIQEMSQIAIDNVRQLENEILKAPQTSIPTSHILHAGVYARTIMIPAGVVLTGALIKVATVLVISGKTVVYAGDSVKELEGYNVITASKNRKQAFVALTDTYITMVFATNSTSIEKAESEFTDEFDILSSRHSDAVNHVVVTGE